MRPGEEERERERGRKERERERVAKETQKQEAPKCMNFGQAVLQELNRNGKDRTEFDTI